VQIEVRTRRVLAVRNEALATRSAMPPGSTMKPFALAALLKSGRLRADEGFLCPGTLSISGRQLNCSHPRVSAPMRVETALAYSCNCFVARVAERLAPGELPFSPRMSELDALRLQALGEVGVKFTVMELAEAYRQLALTAPPAIVAGLEGAVEYGTARRAQVAGVEVAGKTGSVRGAAWFAGWMPSRAPELVVVVRTPGRSGGADAAPIAAEMLGRRR
jgi:cell division protein FtsI/penicillin-binding protein 2